MTEEAQPAPEMATEQPATPNPNRMIAKIDMDNILVGRVVAPSDAEWDAAAPELRFPNGFDNALHRYRLVEHAPDKWRFEPIIHAKDAPKENHDAVAPIVSPLARIVLALATNQAMRQDDIDKVAAFLGTFDGAVS